LPAGYKAFIRQFGPGEVGGFFRIFGPKIPGFVDWGNDILAEIKDWREPDTAWTDVAPPELVARLLCFSTSIGGDAFFWDPEDVRNAKRHEYGIYVWPHGRNIGSVTDVAGSFKEFIEQVCLGSAFDKIGGGWDPEPGPPQRFTPAWRTKKAARKS
jgi:hypothetical protein